MKIQSSIFAITFISSISLFAANNVTIQTKKGHVPAPFAVEDYVGLANNEKFIETQFNKLENCFTDIMASFNFRTAQSLGYTEVSEVKTTLILKSYDNANHYLPSTQLNIEVEHLNPSSKASKITQHQCFSLSLPIAEANRLKTAAPNNPYIKMISLGKEPPAKPVNWGPGD